MGIRHIYIKTKVMGATNSFESEVLRHILLNEAIPNIGDASGLPASATAGSVYICLIKQDPGEAGDITNEADYGGYTRIAVVRGSAGWVEANGHASNVDPVTFPECVSGANDLKYFGICKTLTGDDMMWHGELPDILYVSAEVQPQYDVGQLAINLD